IFGMIPMSIGVSEGGAQAAPLGRAVIGGLIVSTFATLTILPSIYAILQAKASTKSPSLNPMDRHSSYYDGADITGVPGSVSRYGIESMKRITYYVLPIVLISIVCLRPAVGQTIELAPVVTRPLSRTIDLPGEFQPFLSVALHAKVTGYVEKV